MSEEDPTFEEMQANAAGAVAAVDQLTSACGAMFKSLATWERGCLNAGMSPLAAALFTMKLADSFGWPPVGRQK